MITQMAHKRAEKLIDERLDAERGECALAPADAAWLEEHLDACEACRQVDAKRRAMMEVMRGMSPVAAPSGFTARVLQKAKEIEADDAQAEAPRSFGRFAVLGAIAAAAVGLFVVGATIDTTATHPSAVGIAGAGHWSADDARPDFVVRAPGLGPAKMRAQVVDAIERQGGVFEVKGGAIVAKVPRGALVKMMKELAAHGRYKMSKSDAGELPLEHVIVRFELE